MNALLNQPNQRIPLGARDHALLLFLYNTGARADEVARLTVGSLQLGRPPSVRLHGKGNKFRTCPLWQTTTTSLACLVGNRDLNGSVFMNRVSQPITRFGIHRVVTSLRELGQQGGANIGDQARKSTYDTTHNGRPPAARRRRHQYDPWHGLATSRWIRRTSTQKSTSK